MNNLPATTGDYTKDLEVGSRIRQEVEGLSWALGDWANQMLAQYEDSERSLAADMSRTTGVPAETLRQYAKVARAFKPGERSPNLSYTHHLRASAAEHPVQVLQAAETGGLSERDTARLAKGLPVGGEETAQRESSSTVQGASLEEAAIEALRQAERYLQTALDTVSKSGFRCTLPVGQSLMQRLEAISKPFVSLEEAIKAEVGAYL